LGHVIEPEIIWQSRRWLGRLVVFAPDKYGVRLLSIFFPSLDPGGFC